MPFDEIDINAPKDSTIHACLLLKHNLILGFLMDMNILSGQQSLFSKIFIIQMQTDYIHTNREWTKRFHRFQLKNTYGLHLIPKYLTDKEFRHQLAVLRSDQTEFVFEKLWAMQGDFEKDRQNTESNVT